MKRFTLSLVASACLLVACGAEAQVVTVPPMKDGGNVQMPFALVPEWGSMKTPAVWNRPWSEYSREELVPTPSYDIKKLTVPMKELLKNRQKNLSALTAKIFYSTRHMGRYHLDAGEDVGTHQGVDIKMPMGAPVGAIANGEIMEIISHEYMGDAVMQKITVWGKDYVAIYGHCGKILVKAGDIVEMKQHICEVGISGQTTDPHLHLQIDVYLGQEKHTPFQTKKTKQKSVESWTVHPIKFILAY